MDEPFKKFIKNYIQILENSLKQMHHINPTKIF